jgi:hypothetical protein
MIVGKYGGWACAREERILYPASRRVSMARVRSGCARDVGREIEEAWSM